MLRLQIRTATVIAVVVATPVTAQIKPVGKPFALRGVELGITLDQFRAIPVVADEGEGNLRTLCQGDSDEKSSSIDGADVGSEVITCQWFGGRGYRDSSMFVGLGAGQVLPAFDFIDDRGTKRLFRIRSFANSEYAPAILDALTRGYGASKAVTAPFKTVGGASFTQSTTRWDNGLSSITLIQPCRQVQRYCLAYRHTVLGKAYDALVEKRAAAAAERL